MKVLIDTSIWSLALRRRRSGHNPYVLELENLIGKSLVQIIGPIRQELLSGIREQRQFEKLRDRLQAFPDLALTREHYEKAAEFFNICRNQGLQGANTDFLICSVAVEQDIAIFTSDKDFTLFQSHLPIKLHSI